MSLRVFGALIALLYHTESLTLCCGVLRVNDVCH